jgi:SAM-dependent methyltransferase
MAKGLMVADRRRGGPVEGSASRTWCPHLWTWLVRRFQVRSVLDLGCGEGRSTRFFRDLGCAVTGVERCARALRDSVVPDSIVHHDFCAGPYLPPAAPDLIWSCDFLPHVEEQSLDHVLQTFAEARKLILITHTSPGRQVGNHPVHCQPGSYWIRRIENLGFRCDAALSRQARVVSLRDHAGVNHFARSGLVFVRQPLGTVTDTSAWHSLGCWWKAFCINTAFALSPVYRAHRRQKQTLKRAARRN